MTPEQAAAEMAAMGLAGVRLNKRRCPRGEFTADGQRLLAVIWTPGLARTRPGRNMRGPVRLCVYAAAAGRDKWVQRPVTSITGLTAEDAVARLAAIVEGAG